MEARNALAQVPQVCDSLPATPVARGVYWTREERCGWVGGQLCGWVSGPSSSLPQIDGAPVAAIDDVHEVVAVKQAAGGVCPEVVGGGRGGRPLNVLVHPTVELPMVLSHTPPAQRHPLPGDERSVYTGFAALKSKDAWTFRWRHHMESSAHLVLRRGTDAASTSPEGKGYRKHKDDADVTARRRCQHVVQAQEDTLVVQPRCHLEFVLSV